MTYPKRKPSIWITSVAKLLAGDAQCWWQSWFKAHFSGYDKLSGGFNEAEWKMAHTALLDSIHQQAEIDYPEAKISVEDENAFWLNGESCDLGGKPDLVIALPDRVIIDDAKTGQPKASDVIQMMLYMYALPRAFEKYRDKPMTARLKYLPDRYSPQLGPGPPRIVEVPGSSIDQLFITRLGEVIRRVAADAPAIKVPSVRECAWCDISKEDCPERIDRTEAQRGSTDDF
jgi:PD-(D/E)XK nuclease superfamily